MTTLHYMAQLTFKKEHTLGGPDLTKQIFKNGVDMPGERHCELQEEFFMNLFH